MAKQFLIKGNVRNIFSNISLNIFININNLRYADNTTLMAEIIEELYTAVYDSAGGSAGQNGDVRRER